VSLIIQQNLHQVASLSTLLRKRDDETKVLLQALQNKTNIISDFKSKIKVIQNLLHDPSANANYNSCTEYDPNESFFDMIDNNESINKNNNNDSIENNEYIDKNDNNYSIEKLDNNDIIDNNDNNHNIEKYEYIDKKRQQ